MIKGVLKRDKIECLLLNYVQGIVTTKICHISLKDFWKKAVWNEKEDIEGLMDTRDSLIRNLK